MSAITMVIDGRPLSVSYVLAGERYSARTVTPGWCRKTADTDGLLIETGADDSVFVPITMIKVAMVAGKYTAELKHQPRRKKDAKSK